MTHLELANPPDLFHLRKLFWSPWSFNIVQCLCHDTHTAASYLVGLCLKPHTLFRASKCQRSHTFVHLASKISILGPCSFAFPLISLNLFLHLIPTSRTPRYPSFIQLLLKPCDLLQALRIPDQGLHPLLFFLGELDAV